MSRLTRGYVNIAKHPAAGVSCAHKREDPDRLFTIHAIVQDGTRWKKHQNEAPGRRGNALWFWLVTWHTELTRDNGMPQYHIIREDDSRAAVPVKKKATGTQRCRVFVP